MDHPCPLCDASGNSSTWRTQTSASKSVQERHHIQSTVPRSIRYRASSGLEQFCLRVDYEIQETIREPLVRLLGQMAEWAPRTGQKKHLDKSRRTTQSSTAKARAWLALGKTLTKRI